MKRVLMIGVLRLLLWSGADLPAGERDAEDRP